MCYESSIFVIGLEDQQIKQIFLKKIVAIPHVLENERHEIHSLKWNWHYGELHVETFMYFKTGQYLSNHHLPKIIFHTSITAGMQDDLVIVLIGGLFCWLESTAWRNAWLDFNQTWQESSSGAGDSKVFIWYRWPPWGPRGRAPRAKTLQISNFFSRSS